MKRQPPLLIFGAVLRTFFDDLGMSPPDVFSQSNGRAFCSKSNAQGGAFGLASSLKLGGKEKSLPSGIHPAKKDTSNHVLRTQRGVGGIAFWPFAFLFPSFGTAQDKPFSLLAIQTSLVQL